MMIISTATFLRRYRPILAGMNESKKPAQPNNYQSYVMRLWREGADQPWRATLRCVFSGEQKHFTSLDELMAFLHGKTAEPPGLVDE